jgi:ABC-2 type transport system ATP-binding protein
MLREPTHGESVTVLDAVTFDVVEGEFFGILGANGAGKTTLFRILATLITPDGGSAQVAGFDVVQHPSDVRVALTSAGADERSLNWRLSAEENLRLFAALYGLRAADARRRAAECLAIVGLADAGRKMVGAFSSGMKQRLLLARALLPKPRVLLLDEPTRSLDPISARGFRRFLRDEIAASLGCTVLLATHSAEEALELCDRVAILDRGRLAEIGRADALARHYADDRYRVWARSPARARVEQLVAQGLAGSVVPIAGADPGWECLELTLTDGLSGAERALRRLHDCGVAVSRFERVQLTLADLLERVTDAARARDAHA